MTHFHRDSSELQVRAGSAITSEHGQVVHERVSRESPWDSRGTSPNLEPHFRHLAKVTPDGGSQRQATRPRPNHAMSTFTTHRGSLSLPLRRVATQNRERETGVVIALGTSLATTPSSSPELVVRGAFNGARAHNSPLRRIADSLRLNHQTLRHLLASSRSVRSSPRVGGPFISRSIRRSSRAPFFSDCLSPPSTVVPVKARTYTRRTRAPAT